MFISSKTAKYDSVFLILIDFEFSINAMTTNLNFNSLGLNNNILSKIKFKVKNNIFFVHEIFEY
jgi:hypothetical protein